VRNTFTDEVMRRFTQPKNAGDLQTVNGRGKAGDPSCSDVVELQIYFQDNRIKNAKFKVFGCPAAVATADVFIERIKGKTINEALNITEEDITGMLGGLPAESHHCVHLPMEAFRNAKEDYERQRK
jgi:NifU-like protein involved in Fe-S cluster formation